MSDYIRDYSKGKVYKIVVDTDEEYKPYVGSTIEELSRRMGGHRSKYKSWKKGKGAHIRSYDLFDKFGVDKCKIILLEEYSCENISQLLMKEREWFDKMECCNKSKPLRKEHENEEYHIEYRQINQNLLLEKAKKYVENNKEKVSKYQKKYYEANKEQNAEYQKIYRDEHKEQNAEYQKIYRDEHKKELVEKQKKWRETNKEQIAEKKKEKYECVCGDIIRKDSKPRHEKSQKHISFISQN
jgi:hypothetical protein